MLFYSRKTNTYPEGVGQLSNGRLKSKTPPFIKAINTANKIKPMKKPMKKNFISIIPNCPFLLNIIDKIKIFTYIKIPEFPFSLHFRKNMLKKRNIYKQTSFKVFKVNSD